MNLRIVTGVSLTLNVLALILAIAVWQRWLPLGDWANNHYAHKISDFSNYPLGQPDIVFLGDSITAGTSWSESFGSIRFKNRGIGGDTTAGVLNRLEQITSTRPRAVFIMIGTNDLTRGPTDRQVSYRQYEQIVGELRRLSPATQIYLQSILPRGETFRESVEAFNREIRTIAEHHGVIYIDLYPAFLAEDGSIADQFSSDELHLNGAGYQLWIRALEPYIQALHPGPGESLQ